MKRGLVILFLFSVIFFFSCGDNDFSGSTNVELSKKDIHYFEKATDPLAIHSKGVGFFLKGKIKLASIFFKRAIELSPNFAISHYYLGKCLWLSGDKATSKFHFRKVLSTAPKLFDGTEPFANNKKDIIFALGKPQSRMNGVLEYINAEGTLKFSVNRATFLAHLAQNRSKSSYSNRNSFTFWDNTFIGLLLFVSISFVFISIAIGLMLYLVAIAWWVFSEILIILGFKSCESKTHSKSSESQFKESASYSRHSNNNSKPSESQFKEPYFCFEDAFKQAQSIDFCNGSNFEFLKVRFTGLYDYATEAAAKYCVGLNKPTELNYSLTNIGKFTERFTSIILEQTKLSSEFNLFCVNLNEQKNLFNRIQFLSEKGFPKILIDILHSNRKGRNPSAHDDMGSNTSSKQCLELLRNIYVLGLYLIEAAYEKVDLNSSGSSTVNENFAQTGQRFGEQSYKEVTTKRLELFPEEYYGKRISIRASLMDIGQTSVCIDGFLECRYNYDNTEMKNKLLEIYESKAFSRLVVIKGIYTYYTYMESAYPFIIIESIETPN
jgi:tetratricopeptide (TPR) repeat protein